jgi:diguanylate cyclase (GGDEF)-like protein
MDRLRRYLLPVITAFYLFWHLASPEPHSLRDLYLYNAIWLVALAITVYAPLTFDRVALSAISLAIFLWGVGSLATSFDQFSSQEPRFTLAAQLLYTLFYPLMLLAIPRFSSSTTRLRPMELLDALIFGLGFTSIAATVLAVMIFPGGALVKADNYFLMFYCAGDISLLLVLAMTLITRKNTSHTLLLAAGVAIFTATDIYYLTLALNNRYAFGVLADDGWLIAIVLMAISTINNQGGNNPAVPIHPALVALSIFISPILLAISALRPELFPTYIVAPSIANLLLAFIRMNTALREAKILVDERNLARTDELTGLANRRRLISELTEFSQAEGALLLLDLNQFKPVNDNYGHEIGDLLLREVAKRFTRAIPEGSLLARLGGDEFGVLIPGSQEETIEVAHALRASLSYPCQIKGLSISVGVSVGHVYNDGAGNLLKRADEAMYRAKQMDMGVAQS